MSSYSDPQFTFIAILFLMATTLIGGLLPQYLKLSERGLQRFLALSVGILLDVLFYRPLPTTLAVPFSTTFVLIGFIAPLSAELFAVVPREPQPGGSREHGMMIFYFLSAHSLLEGLSLSTQFADTASSVPFLIALLIQKLAEAFSLMCILVLAGFERRRSLVLLGIFSLIAPVCLLAGVTVAGLNPPVWQATAGGLAAGILLYVTLCDLLPAAFRSAGDRKIPLLVLLAGLTAVGLFLNL
jgi:zinc transporter ZupT